MFRSTKRVLAGMAALAALALGGAAIAGANTSSTSTTAKAPSSAPSGGSNGSSARPAFNGPAPGTAAHEDAETTVTGEAATKAKAAAVKAVGEGTAGTVTTDYTKTGYETTVTKSDGSKVEIHLDSSFQAMQGPGGHGGPGAPSGAGAPGGAPPAGTYGG